MTRRLASTIAPGLPLRLPPAVLADLQSAGAVQLGTYGPSPAPPPPALHWPTDGNWTPEPGSDPPSPGVYALSIAGAPPSLSSGSLEPRYFVDDVSDGIGFRYGR